MHLNWSIRSADENDAAALSVIGAATFLETFAGLLPADAIIPFCQYDHSEAAYRKYLQEGAIAWLVEVEEGQAPIGFALAAPATLPGSTRDDFELRKIYSLSRFHGGGLGQALLRTVIAAAKARHSERLMLGVYAGNNRAIAFYKKSGFIVVGDRRFQVGPRHFDDYVMAMTIKNN